MTLNDTYSEYVFLLATGRIRNTECYKKQNINLKRQLGYRIIRRKRLHIYDNIEIKVCRRRRDYTCIRIFLSFFGNN